jgi:hypothetical protein
VDASEIVIAGAVGALLVHGIALLDEKIAEHKAEPVLDAQKRKKGKKAKAKKSKSTEHKRSKSWNRKLLFLQVLGVVSWCVIGGALAYFSVPADVDVSKFLPFQIGVGAPGLLQHIARTVAPRIKMHKIE